MPVQGFLRFEGWQAAVFSVCVAFSFRNSIAFAFFRSFNGRFRCVNQNHLILGITFQRRFPSWQRKRSILYQRVFHPLDSSVDITFRYPITGRYMGTGTVFPQIFQGGQQQILYAQLWRPPTAPVLFRISFLQNLYHLVKCCPLYPGNSPKFCVWIFR